MRRDIGILVLVGGLATAGCSEPTVVRVPIVGSMQGAWTIDGARPDPASCTRAGLDQVRLSATEPSGEGFSRVAIDCRLGEIDTRPMTTLVAGRTYVIRLEGMRSDAVVSTGPSATVTVPAGGLHAVAPSWDIRTSGI